MDRMKRLMGRATALGAVLLVLVLLFGMWLIRMDYPEPVCADYDY
jgi:hypothetical protein